MVSFGGRRRAARGGEEEGEEVRDTMKADGCEAGEEGDGLYSFR